MTPATASPHPQFLRRTSSVLDKVIHGRPSFRDILARASLLDLGYGDPSSAESIARYFLRRQQDSLDARLLQQQRLRRIGLRNLMSLLWLSSHCSWKASLLCGSLYRSILDAKLAISRVQAILEAPSPHSQVDDLLLSLTHLQNLLSEHTLREIQDGKDHFSELDTKIKRYQHRLRVRALSHMRALNQGAHHGMSRCRRTVRGLKTSLTGWFTLCNCCTGCISGGEEPLIQRKNDDGGDEELSIDGVNTGGDWELSTDATSTDGDDDKFDVDVDTGAAAHQSGLLSPLYKAHLQLHQLEICMHAVNIMFDTLKSLVEGTQSQTLNHHYIESLRSEPLMFDGVAGLVSVRHASLSKHLDDLREQVLFCFCFINNARDLVYHMY